MLVRGLQKKMRQQGKPIWQCYVKMPVRDLQKMRQRGKPVWQCYVKIPVRGVQSKLLQKQKVRE